MLRTFLARSRMRSGKSSARQRVRANVALSIRTRKLSPCRSTKILTVALKLRSCETGSVHPNLLFIIVESFQGASSGKWSGVTARQFSPHRCITKVIPLNPSGCIESRFHDLHIFSPAPCFTPGAKDALPFALWMPRCRPALPLITPPYRPQATTSASRR